MVSRKIRISKEYNLSYFVLERPIQHAYDSFQKLQKVSYPTGKVEQFQYDNAGNRALKKYGTAENFRTGNYLEERYQYDNRNRLLERRNPETVTFYQYDNQGNTVSELTKRFIKPETKKVQNGGITIITNSMAQTELEQYKTYEYNCFNKTEKVVVEDYQSEIQETNQNSNKKNIHIQKNFYDAENLRYGIEEDGERTNFVTNGWSVFTELDAEWKTKKRLLRVYGIVASEELGENASIDKAGVEGYHFYHLNEHGDVEYITSDDSKIANGYTYDAFGNITKSEELVKNRYTYNGEQYDKTTEQYYLRARYYNPLICRFTQEDVYRGDGLNLYAYCGANPVMYVDPSGYIKNWVTPDSNYDLNDIYDADTSRGKKNAMSYIKFIEVEASDIKAFNSANMSGSDVIQIDFKIDGKKALKYNKTGELGLLYEHMIEQNIVLNKISTENPDILQKNLKFAQEVYSNPNSSSKKMVDDYRKEGRKKLKGTNSGDTPHALDTCAGGSANMFLESYRDKYANGTMGVSLKNHMSEIEPGKMHKFNLVVEYKNNTLTLEEFLKQNNDDLNKSKCKVK